MRLAIPGPGESFDHSYIDKTDSRIVDVACYHRDRTTFPADEKVSGAMAEAVFVHVIRLLDRDV